MAKFIITVEGEQAYIDAGLDSFARSSGYVDSEDEGNPTKIQVAEADLKRYFREKVSAYNANLAAEAARQAALDQSIAALDETTLTILIEE